MFGKQDVFNLAVGPDQLEVAANPICSRGPLDLDIQPGIQGGCPTNSLDISWPPPREQDFTSRAPQRTAIIVVLKISLLLLAVQVCMCLRVVPPTATVIPLSEGKRG